MKLNNLINNLKKQRKNIILSTIMLLIGGVIGYEIQSIFSPKLCGTDVTKSCTDTNVKIESPSPIKSLVTQDGKILFVGSEDGKIRLWNMQTGKLQYTISEHTKSITTLALSSDGKTLVSASDDGTVKIFDIKIEQNKAITISNSQSRNFLNPLKKGKIITSLGMSSDGKIIVIGGQDETIFIWEKQNKQFKELPSGDTGIESLVMNNDATIIVSGHYGGKINVWQKNNGQYSQRTFNSGAVLDIYFVAMSANGKTIISSECKPEIKIWDPDTKPISSIKSNADICLVAISANGNIVAGLTSGEIVKVWDMKTGKELHSFSPTNYNSNPNQNGVRSLVLTPDGRTVVNSFDKNIEIRQLPKY